MDKIITSLDDTQREHVTSEFAAQKREECLELVGQLIAESKCPYRKPSREAFVMMFHSLRVLGDPQLACEFLSGISDQFFAYKYLYSKTVTGMLIAMCSVLGWNKLQPGLNQLFECCAARNVVVCAQFLDRFATSELALISQWLEASCQLSSIVHVCMCWLQRKMSSQTSLPLTGLNSKGTGARS